MNLWWHIFFFVLGAIILIVWRSKGPRAAVGISLALGLLAPEWLKWQPSLDYESVWITVRLALVILALGLYVLNRQATYNLKLVGPDWAMLALVTTHFVSDTLNEGFSLALPFRAYGEWFAPYIAGRLAIQTFADIRSLTPWFLFVSLVLCVLGTAESIIGAFSANSNLYEALVGIRPEEFTREMTRELLPGLRLKRAFGPAMHTIYFGAAQFLLLPYAVYACSRSLRGGGSTWWRFAPLVVIIGASATLTRSIWVALPIAFFVITLFRFPSTRYVFAGLGIAACVAGFFFSTQVIGFFEEVSGEASGGQKFMLDGKEYRYTGTSNRQLLFKVYDYALLRAGPLGFGTERCSHFPPNVPRDPNDAAEVYEKVRYIDNEFLLMTLRFGWLGGLCFAAAIAAALWCFGETAYRPQAEGAAWSAAAAGTLAGAVFILCTVFMPTDYGMLLLFTLGSSAGLAAERRNPLVAQMEQAELAAMGISRRRRRSSET